MTVTGWEPGQPGDLDEFLVARRDPDGTWAPAGRVKFGLDRDARARLRERLVELDRGGRNGVRWVSPVIELNVEHHGVPGGPLRDGIICAAHKSDIDMHQRVGQRARPEVGRERKTPVSD